MTLTPDRFVDGGPMALAGLRQTFSFAEAARIIPEMWAAFTAMPIPFLRQRVAYGVICHGDPESGELEYMCAGEVASFEGLAPEIGRIRIPAAHYAVFEHKGGVETISETWDKIFREFAPTVRPSPTPDFERYGADFESGKPGGVDIWFPVLR